MPFRSTRIARAADAGGSPVDVVILKHDERHIRRKLLHTKSEDVVMLDLKEPVVLEHGDLLVLENDAGHIEVIAAEEPLFEVRARDKRHQMELAWHLGNRHFPAQIDDDRILIERDHVIRAMLEGLGATVTEVTERFSPLHGAYHGHGGHGHHHHDH